MLDKKTNICYLMFDIY